MRDQLLTSAMLKEGSAPAENRAKVPSRKAQILESPFDADGQDVVERIRRADISEVIDPHLFQPARLSELRSLIDAYGETAADTIVDVVMRTPTGGSGIRHCRKSWNYFRGAIEDQIRIETGERPLKEPAG
jgi:hypothetical protein